MKEKNEGKCLTSIEFISILNDNKKITLQFITQYFQRPSNSLKEVIHFCILETIKFVEENEQVLNDDCELLTAVTDFYYLVAAWLMLGDEINYDYYIQAQNALNFVLDNSGNDPLNLSKYLFFLLDKCQFYKYATERNFSAKESYRSKNQKMPLRERVLRNNSLFSLHQSQNVIDAHQNLQQKLHDYFENMKF